MATPEPNPTAPKAFISYSWDDDAHREWVKQLATRLRENGVDVTLDRWHAAPGDQIPAFMERAVRENDFVIAICTPRFKERSDERGGGIGYEGDIITAHAFEGGDKKKFIPVLRRGSWREAAPAWLVARVKIDLSSDPYSELEYEDLLRTLLDEREAAPPIRSRPKFGDKKGLEASLSSAPVTLLAGSSIPQHQPSITSDLGVWRRRLQLLLKALMLTLLVAFLVASAGMNISNFQRTLQLESAAEHLEKQIATQQAPPGELEALKGRLAQVETTAKAKSDELEALRKRVAQVDHAALRVAVRQIMFMSNNSESNGRTNWVEGIPYIYARNINGQLQEGWRYPVEGGMTDAVWDGKTVVAALLVPVDPNGASKYNRLHARVDPKGQVVLYASLVEGVPVDDKKKPANCSAYLYVIYKD